MPCIPVLFLLFVLVALAATREWGQAGEDILAWYAYKPEDNPLESPSGPTPGAVVGVTREPSGAVLTLERGTIEVRFLTDGLVQVVALPPGSTGPEPSYAVLEADRPPVAARHAEDGESVSVSTGQVTVSVRKTDGTVTVRGVDGPPLVESAVFSFREGRPRVVWSVPPDRRYLGCGEKTGPLNRRARPMLFWNNDWAAWPHDGDPLYQSVPFTLGMDGATAHGLLVDNTWRSVWDLGRAGSSRSGVQADGGSLVMYFVAPGTPAEVLERYTDLVGRMPLPPLWSLGYHQSRYSYYPEETVRQLAARFRRERVPCDVIYFDIHYMDAYKVFTWDRSRFPEPARLIGDLRQQGFHSVVILDPGVKVEPGYEEYEQLLENGLTVRDASGRRFEGSVWPGPCLFPDFTRAEGRAWWGERYRGMVEAGVAGFWNDMNEPAVFGVPGHTMPPDTQFDGDGSPGSHLRYHNVYGQLMARGTYEGVRALRPGERAWVLTRAAYAGSHRYAAAWTGDNVANWDHLRVSLPMLLSMGLSGQAFCGPDVGGFEEDPSPELFVRWVQAAALLPFFRVHSAGAGETDADQATGYRMREPWAFGPEALAINRASIELRYRLMPYLYTVFEEMTRTGAPVMRPLLFQYPNDPAAADIADQYLLGRDLLVAPVLHEGATSREVYLPAGDWYDYHTGARVAGGRTVPVEAPLDHLPLFVRAGAILPTQQTVQHTGASANVPLVFRVYLGDGRAEGCSYEDDGITMGFEDGAFRRTCVTAEVREGRTALSTTVEGTWASARPEPRYEVIGGPPATSLNET